MTRRPRKGTPPVAAVAVPGVRILVVDGEAMPVASGKTAGAPATAGVNAPFRKRRARFVF